MTTIMLLGDLPDALRSALEPAGLQATTEQASDVRLAALQLSPDATPAEWAQLNDLASSGVSVLVLAHDDTQATKARTLRAAYVLTGNVTQETLVPLLEMFSQIDATKAKL